MACTYGTRREHPRRMLKKAVQQGRSERRAEAYPLGYVEGLNDARTLLADFFSILPGIADYQCQYLPIILSILFGVNSMEARRMTGREQLRIGTDDGQPQGLEFHRQRQMQDMR